MPYLITSREEYDYAVGRGYEPLLGGLLEMEHGLRLEVQREKFGSGHTPAENERFYRWCWAKKTHECEECLRPLEGYSAVYISHIRSRGACPEMAHDPRNTNILCWQCHCDWENGVRERMRIYRINQKTISILQKEYYEQNRTER